MTEQQKQERAELKIRNLEERAELKRRAFQAREDGMRKTREDREEELAQERRAAARERTRLRRREASRRNIRVAWEARRGQRGAKPPEPINATFWVSGAKGLVLVGGSHPKPDHQAAE